MKRALLAGLVAGGLVAAGHCMAWILLCGNLHTVIAHEFYRSAQPTSAQLEGWIHQHGIRTVINLRGRFTPFDKYEEELATTQRLGVQHRELSLCALRLPTRQEVLAVMEVLDASPRPVLFHCESGGDRSGLVAGMTLLLYTDCDVRTAARQLHLRFGHFPFDHRRRSLSQFFRKYGSWLSVQAQPHSPERFRQWAREVYCDK
jgi:protein tyrosine/serine phosphatase